MIQQTQKFVLLASVVVLSLTATACRTFNYTEADMDRERWYIDQGLANWHGWGAGSFGGGISPKIDCGAINVGGFGGTCGGQ